MSTQYCGNENPYFMFFFSYLFLLCLILFFSFHFSQPPRWCRNEGHLSWEPKASKGFVTQVLSMSEYIFPCQHTPCILSEIAPFYFLSPRFIQAYFLPFLFKHEVSHDMSSQSDFYVKCDEFCFVLFWLSWLTGWGRGVSNINDQLSWRCPGFAYRHCTLTHEFLDGRSTSCIRVRVLGRLWSGGRSHLYS